MGKIQGIVILFLMYFLMPGCQDSKQEFRIASNDDIKVKYKFTYEKGLTFVKGNIIVRRENFDQPIAFNVVERGYPNGTVTDKNGDFSLKLRSKTSKIEISFSGFERLTINQ